MSIQLKVDELKSIQNELKSLRIKGNLLRKRLKIIEEEIKQYLNTKNQQGLKYKDTVIVKETKITNCAKKKVTARTDAINILTLKGIENPDKVFDEIMASQKGEQVKKSNLKVSKINNKE